VPVPKPGKNESKEDFISRCISFLHRENPKRPNDQNIAIAYDAWRKAKKAAAVDGLDEKTFLATMHSIKTGDEKNLATFYLMNTSPNRLKWGVTDKALEEALPSLLGKSIGCGPGYKIDEHYRKEAIPVGEWVSFNKPNGYALATAEIKDNVVLENLRRGDWGPISVVIDSYKESSKKGNQVIESFKFQTVDFVDVPAFPQAGFMNFAGQPGEAVVAPLELCASFYESQSNGQAPGSLNPEEKRKMQEQIAELKLEVETLTANYTELKKEHEDLKAGLEKPADDPKDDDPKDDVEEDPKYKELEAKVKFMEDERHAEHVAAALEARLKADLVKEKDQKAEKERLAGFDDKTLAMLTLDAGGIAVKLEKIKPTGPKTKYTQDDRTEFDAAVDDMRDRLGFEPRTREAKE